MTVLLREAIGDRLRHARTNKDRTLREISRVARVSLGYLSEVERGRKEASSELLAAICEALDLPLDELLSNVATDVRALSSVASGLGEHPEPATVPAASGAEQAEASSDLPATEAAPAATASASAAMPGMSGAVLAESVPAGFAMPPNRVASAGSRHVEWQDAPLGGAMLSDGVIRTGTLGNELADLRLSPNTLPPMGTGLTAGRAAVIVAA
ncbi:transcriptional regulator with XRE-family HTH domain [Tamaricihabitans halophyticus]|uniref:Transcriptional regulator with XRE-family HTH domain n=1 Tax=Tamaricihabitans halophyticus TaxID=1262583 RepID=A0A4V2SR20_9PSEU|nr:transcriptional regulator with XRE-family HTH domain [Tamaricihabitans halophyticus]